MDNSENITNINCNSNRSVAQIGINDNISTLITAVSGLGEKAEFLLDRKMYSTIAKDLISSVFNKVAGIGGSIIGVSEYLLTKDKSVSEIIDRELSIELKRLNCPQLSVRLETSDRYSAFNATAVAKNSIINKPIVSGDIVIGLASSGLHVNGFSLIKELYYKGKLTEADMTDILQPSYNYYPEVVDLIKKEKIKLGVNITKGGIYYCLNKVLPKGLKADLNLKHIPHQPVFDKLKTITEENEFYTAFNAGIGFCLIAERACDEIFFQACRKYEPIVLGVIE